MSQRRTSQITLFLCPVEECDIRFKSTRGRTQHICAKHPNFGVNEPTGGDSERESQSDDMNTQAGTGSHQPVDSSPSSHTSQLLDQADEHMAIDMVSDFLQLEPPMAQAGTGSPFQVLSPPLAFDDLRLSPFSTSQSPGIHPHDESSDAYDSESIGDSQATSSSPFSDSSPADTTASADESATTCASTDYHPILNGKFTHSISSAFYWLIIARPCDEHGNFLDDRTTPDPPLLLRTRDQDDWTPYSSRLEFETAEFLYQRCKMSARNLDFLMQLWHASLVHHGDSAPFKDHRDLYRTIDATPIGGVLWESFNITYNGPELESNNTPAWMNQSFEIYFRDPRLLFVEMLGNPSFANDFDYMPYREFNANGTRRYQHFMSGNWAWKQAVCDLWQRRFIVTFFRIWLHCKILTQPVRCLYRSSWGVTKQPFLWQLVRMITGHCMHRLEMSTTIYGELMEMALSL